MIFILIFVIINPIFSYRINWDEMRKNDDKLVFCEDIYDNKYGTTVSTFILADKDGLQMNKQLYEKNKKITLHGIWPRERCEINQARLKMKEINSTLSKEIKTAINVGIVTFSDYSQYLEDFSFKNSFWYHEYVKHYYLNGYHYEFFLENIYRALKKISYSGLNVAYPHSIRFNKWNVIEQVVEIEYPSEVQIWNFKNEFVPGHLFKNPVSNEEINMTQVKNGFCISPNGSFFCMQSLLDEILSPSFSVLESMQKYIKISEAPQGIAVERIVSEGKKIYEAYKQNDYEFFATKILGLSTAIGATTSQLIGKINTEKIDMVKMSNVVLNLIIYLIATSVVVIGSWYFEQNVFFVIEQTIIWLVGCYILNCVANVFSRFHKRKTIFSVISCLLLVSVLAYLSLNNLYFENNVDNYFNFGNISFNSKMEVLNNMGFVNKVNCSQSLVSFGINYNNLVTIMRLIIIPSIVIYAFFRKSVTKLIHNVTTYDEEKNLSVIGIIFLNIFGVFSFFFVLFLNYDFLKIDEFLKIKEFFNNNYINLEQFNSLWQQWVDGQPWVKNYISLADDLDFTIVGVVTIVLIIAVCSQFFLEIVLKQFFIIRVSEITLFFILILYKFDSIFKLFGHLYDVIVDGNYSHMLNLTNLVSLIIITIVLQIWAQYTTPFLLITEFLLFLPILKYIATSKILGFKLAVDSVSIGLGIKGYENWVYIFLAICCVCYMNHSMFGLPVVYRYLTTDSFVVEKAWKRGIIKSVATLIKIISALIGLAYLTQYILPITSLTINSGFSFWTIVISLVINVWFIFWLIVTYNLFQTYRRAKFGRWYAAKVSLVLIWGLSFFFGLISWLWFLYFIIMNVWSINLSGHLFMQILPHFFGVIILTRVSYFVTSCLEKMRYWLNSFEEQNRYTRLFLGTILELLRSQFGIFVYMCKWATFTGFTIKIISNFYSLFSVNEYPWWQNWSAFINFIPYLCVSIIFMDLMFGIIISMANWLSCGIKLKWVVPYCRKNVDDIKKNLKVDYLKKEVEYDGIVATVWDHLTKFNVLNSEDEVIQNECNEFSNLSQATRFVNKLGEGEAVRFRVHGDLKNLNGTPSLLEQSDIHNKYNPKSSMTYKRTSAQSVNSKNLFEDLALGTTTSFEESDGFYAVEEWYDSSIGAKSMSADKFKECSPVLQNKSWYFPFISDVSSKLDSIAMMNKTQAYYNENPNISKPLIDLLEKGSKLNVKDNEFIDCDTVYVEEVLNESLEFLKMAFVTPFAIIGKMFDGFGITSIADWFLNKTYVDDINPKYILTNVGYEDCLFSDNIWTLHEWMLKSRLTIKDIIKIIGSNKKENFLEVFVNTSGKLFCTTDRDVAANMHTFENNKGDRVFNIMRYKRITNNTPVRPAIITTYMTVSTDVSDCQFHVKLNKGLEVLFDPVSQIYLSPAIDFDNYPGSELPNLIKSDKRLRAVVGASTGLVYVKSPVISKRDECSEVDKNKHIGSCSIVRDDDKEHLFVITNRHVVQDLYADSCQNFIDENQQKFTESFRSEMVSVFGYGGKTLEIPLKKLIVSGEDVVVFSIDKKEEKAFIQMIVSATDIPDYEVWGMLATCGKIKFTDILGNDDKLQLNGTCLLNSVRQTDRVHENDKSKVIMRMTILQYNLCENMYDILGYATPGMSGSPLWGLSIIKDYETGYIYNAVTQVGIVSAVEKNGRTALHMTRIVTTDVVHDAIEYNKNSSRIRGRIQTLKKYHNFNAILPCRTEKMAKKWNDRELLRWCGIINTVDSLDQFSKNKEPLVDLDSIFCTLSDERLIKQEYYKHKKYYDIYDNEFSLLDLKTNWSPHVLFGDKIESVNRSVNFKSYNNYNSVPHNEYGYESIDLGVINEDMHDISVIKLSSYIGISKLLEIIDKCRNNNWIIHTFDTYDFFWVPELINGSLFWNVFMGKMEGNKFVNYTLLGKNDYVTVDTEFLLEAASRSFHVSIDDWVDKFSEIAEEDTIFTAYCVDGYWFFKTYTRFDVDRYGLKGKFKQISEDIAEPSMLHCSGTLTLFVQDDYGNELLHGVCKIVEGDNILDKIKQISDEMKEIKDNEKLLNARISKLRSKIADYQQNPEYIERKRAYEAALQKYNEEKELYKTEKEKDDEAVKKLLQQKREIEQDYVDKIKALRNKKILNNQLIKERKDILTIKNKEKNERIDKDIEKLKALKKKCDMEIMNHMEKKKMYHISNDKFIEKKKQENDSYSKKIALLQSEKNDMIEEKNKERREIALNVPKKPAPEMNPEMDKLMQEMRAEITDSRKELGNLKKEHANLVDELNSIKKKYSELESNLMDQKTINAQLHNVIDDQNIRIGSIMTDVSLFSDDCKRKNKSRIIQEESYERKRHESDDDYSSDDKARQKQDKSGLLKHKRTSNYMDVKRNKKIRENNYELKQMDDSGRDSSDFEQKNKSDKRGILRKKDVPAKPEREEQPKPQRIKPIPKPRALVVNDLKDYKIEFKEFEVIEIDNFDKYKDVLDLISSRNVRVRAGAYRKICSIIENRWLNGQYSNYEKINKFYLKDFEKKRVYYITVDSNEKLSLLRDIVYYLHRDYSQSKEMPWTMHKGIEDKLNKILTGDKFEVNYLSDIFLGQKIVKMGCDVGLDDFGVPRETILKMVICKEELQDINKKLDKYLPSLKKTKKILISEKGKHAPWVEIVFKKWVKCENKRYIPLWVEAQLQKGTFFENFSIIVEYEDYLLEKLKMTNNETEVFCLKPGRRMN